MREIRGTRSFSLLGEPNKLASFFSSPVAPLFSNEKRGQSQHPPLSFSLSLPSLSSLSLPSLSSLSLVTLTLQASPLLNGTFVPLGGNVLDKGSKSAAARGGGNDKQRALGALDDAVSCSLSAADAASDAARQALGDLGAKASASLAGLPPAAKTGAAATAAAAAAALKNATTTAAREKAALAAGVKRASRNATDALVDGSWAKAARLESDAAELLDGGAGNKSAENEGRDGGEDYVGAGPPPRKTQAAVAAGRAATAAALEAAKGLFDAAFLKGRKERFGVLVSIDVRFDPRDGRGIGGAAPVTVAVPAAAAAGGKGEVTFSSEVVRGVPGDTVISPSPSLVVASAIAAAVRETLLSKLLRDASLGDVDAAALLGGVGGGGSDVDGRRAPLMSVRGASVDALRVYLVRVSMPALLLPSPPLLPRPSGPLRARTMNAINDAAPGNAACASLRERTGFDACGAIDAGTHLAVSGVRFLAADVGEEEGAAGPLPRTLAAEAAGALPAGRRSRSQDGGGSGGIVGFPRIDMGGRDFGSFLSSIFESITKIIDLGKKDNLEGPAKFFSFLGPVSAIAASATCLGILVSTIFGSEAGVNENTKYLNEINATTHEILENMRYLNKTLSLIEDQFGGLQTQIMELGCSQAILATDSHLDVIKNRWREYNETTIFGPRFAVEAALADRAAGRPVAVDPSSVHAPWVNRVLAENGDESLHNALMNLHDRLAREDLQTSQQLGKIYACANAIEAAFKRKFQVNNGSASRVFSFDDRQLFLSLENLLSYFQIWQARGSQMLQDALTFKAQESTLSAWAANQRVPGCADRSPASAAAASRDGCVLDADQLPPDPSTLCVRLSSRSGAALPANFATARAWCDRLNSGRIRSPTACNHR